MKKKSNIFKKFACSLLSLVLVFSVFGCGQNNLRLITNESDYVKSQTRGTLPYASLSFNGIGGKDVLPVGGFYGPYSSVSTIDGQVFPELVTDEIYASLSEAGVNVIVYSIDSYSGSGSGVFKALELGEKYNIGYFVDDLFIREVAGRFTTYKEGQKLEDKYVKQMSQMVSNLSKYSSFLGIHGFDEPFYSQLPGLKAVSDSFKEITKGSDLNMYCNAIGQVSDTPAGDYFDRKGWDWYLNEYMTQTELPFISCTAYTWSPNWTGGNLTTMFAELATYRSLGEKYNVPIWRMLQAGGQWNDLREWKESVDYYPNEGEFFWDINMSLAFGCKGIQYFPVIEPVHFAYAVDENGVRYYDSNRNGLIGCYGNKTQWWHYAKKAKQQMTAIDHILMNSANEGLLVHGENAKKVLLTNQDSSKIDTVNKSVIQNGNYNELVKISGDDSVIGCFNYNGKTALYVVNYSPKQKSNTTLHFGEQYGYEIIQRGESIKVTGKTIPLQLEAGEGVLITLL